jgi:hypothetical protein
VPVRKYVDEAAAEGVEVPAGMLLSETGGLGAGYSSPPLAVMGNQQTNRIRVLQS